MSSLLAAFSRAGTVARNLLRGRGYLGFCSICEGRTIFIRTGNWLREELLCGRCWSIPRWRAVLQVIEERFPAWRQLRVHESSPGGSASEKLRRECRQYVGSQYFLDTPRGSWKWGYRCEDLERQTFESESFDLVVTQDVFEHVLDPASGFREVARTLKPGGAHVFTVPWYSQRKTVVRAVKEGAVIRHLLEPDYHRNPIDSRGSLVVTEWGADLADFIFRSSGLETTTVSMHDPSRGLDGEFLEVFITTKLSCT